LQDEVCAVVDKASSLLNSAMVKRQVAWYETSAMAGKARAMVDEAEASGGWS
jgi:hypothetical protein